MGVLHPGGSVGCSGELATDGKSIATLAWLHTGGQSLPLGRDARYSKARVVSTTAVAHPTRIVPCGGAAKLSGTVRESSTRTPSEQPTLLHSWLEHPLNVVMTARTSPRLVRLDIVVPQGEGRVWPTVLRGRYARSGRDKLGLSAAAAGWTAYRWAP